VLNATEHRFHSRGTHRLQQQPLETPALAFLLRGLATVAKRGLERSRVDQEPTLDMRVGDRIHDGAAALAGNRFEFLPAFEESLTVGIPADDQEVRQLPATGSEVTGELSQFSHELTTAPTDTVGLERDLDTLHFR